MSLNGSNQETEVKLRVPDPASAEQLVLSAGFHVSVPRVLESNTVYDNADHPLRDRGMLLRLRRAGDHFTLTVKGPVVVGDKHKSRQEDEIVVSNYETCHRMLVQLGYQPTFVYEKYRTEYISTIQSGTVTIDETPIGTFLELEGSSDWIDETARHLSFREADYILDSYGKLYGKFCIDRGIPISNMIFGI